MLTRHRIRVLLALLLPLMVLRALLPAGFMPVVEQGELRIVMCSAGIAQPQDDGTDSGDGNSGQSGAGDCPFAHSAASAPPIRQTAAIPAPLQVLQLSPSDSEDLPPATGPPRRAAARAPPISPEVLS